MKKERVAIFIDGSNLYHNLKRFNIKTKFEEIIKKIETKREIVEVFYYTALLDKSINEDKYNKHRRFPNQINKLPNFHIVLCNLRKAILEDGSLDFAIK